MKSRGVLAALLLMVLGSLGISFVQPSLAASVHAVKQRDDVFLLPPPAQLRGATLGYRAAAADLLWAKLILEYGLHWQEKRPFPDSVRYIDGVLAVEPTFPPLYEFVDTILTYPPPPGGTDEDAHTAHAYLERGTRERPYDATVWLRFGQFTAFIAPSFLKDKQEIERWRVEGAKAIARAVELGSDSNRALAATTILDKAGERDAAIAQIQRAYAVTDDPTVREEMLLRLGKLKATADAEQAITVVDRQWHAYYPFLSRGQALLLGPRAPTARCAGPGSYARRGCERDWTASVEAAK